MAHGENAKNTQGKEWWSRRPLKWTSVRAKGMKAWKKILHGIERAKSKQLIKKELNE